MPRPTNITVQNQFGKGLITEATGLTFPENACTDTDNCVFSYLGEASRRPGFDFESSFTKFNVSVTGRASASYLWDNVANTSTISFVVVQNGDSLYFYKVTENQHLSSNRHSHVSALASYLPANSTISTAQLRASECQFSNTNGVLFVTNQYLEAFAVYYNPDIDDFIEFTVNIYVRDLEGDRADNLGVSDRPVTNEGGLTASHNYNLKNQGWNSGQQAAWFTSNGTQPSNVDVNWYYIDGSGFNFLLINSRAPGNSPAPKGHFIYTLPQINRSVNITGATNDQIGIQRFTTSAPFAGRMFWSGMRQINYTSKIFFSQVITSDITQNPLQAGQCFQSNDPTSEELFALLPTDGGVIDIRGAGTVFKLFPMLNSLLVFCSNGVWMITGSTGLGFTANDYAIHKISSINTISATSFIDIEGVPYWWCLDGIYTVKTDPQTNAMKVVNATDGIIRSYYLNLTSQSKQYARGIYNPVTKIAQWLFKSISASATEDIYTFDRILNLNMLTGAFYPWSISTTNVKIKSLALSSFKVNAITTDTAFDVSKNKYFVFFHDSADEVTFAECNNTNNVDWFTFDSTGVVYDSHFVTGYMIRGKALLRFQQDYIVLYLDNSVNNSFKIRSEWEYATSGNTGRWSTEQVFTPTATNTDYIPIRIKIRGRGLTSQFRIFNNGNNPFIVTGWSVLESVNPGP